MENFNPETEKAPKEHIKRHVGEEYDINFHLNKSNLEIKEGFYKLQEKIKLLPSVDERANQKIGITYRTTKSFTRFEFGKSYIDVLLREAKYDDPKKLVQDITSYGIGFNGHVKIRSAKDVDYIFGLVKQSYEQTL